MSNIIRRVLIYAAKDLKDCMDCRKPVFKVTNIKSLFVYNDGEDKFGRKCALEAIVMLSYTKLHVVKSFTCCEILQSKITRHKRDAISFLPPVFITVQCTTARKDMTVLKMRNQLTSQESTL